VNKSLKQMKMLIVAVAVAFAPLYASEVTPAEVMVVAEPQEETTENSAVWYNKDYVKAAIAAAATVAAVYTVAVHKNKIASSFAALTAFVVSRSTQVKNTVEEKTETIVEVTPQATEKEGNIVVAKDEQDRSIASNVKNLLASVWERVPTITLPKFEINESSSLQKINDFNME
jgi:hypothetical protein